MKIKKNDTVVVTTGKDKGTKGKVVRALPSVSKVVVEGVNIVKRHQKARTRGEAGQIVEVSLPIHVSNVSLLDPKSDTPTRVGYSIEGGKKTRVAKKSGQKIA